MQHTSSKFSRLRILLCLIAAVLAAPVLAQPDAGTLLNQQQRQQPQLPDRLPDAARETVRPALKASAGAAFVLRSVRFTGATHLASEKELQALVADAIGKTLDFAGMEQLTERVTEFLRGKGAFLARAYLPQQDVTDGTLEVTLLEGRLDGKAGDRDSFVLVPDAEKALRIDPKHLAAVAATHLPAGATAREEALERAILLMNDLPGISARARLEPGQEADSTRVAIDVQEGPLFTGTASFDNHGNRDTGIEQLSANLQINDPLRIGDQLNATATYTQGLDLLRLGYVLPLGSQGLKLGASWTAMDYAIIRGVGKTSGQTGDSSTGNLTLSYPLIRSRTLNLYGALAYAHKALRDDSTAGLLSDKRLDNWTGSLSGDSLDRLGGGGLTSWSFAYTSGDLDLSRVATDAAADATGYRAQGRFDKFNVNLGRLQKLPGQLTLFANLSAQAAGKNLDSSEKFILGGPYGIRAYPGSEGLGDSGWLANLELRYDLPGGTPWGQLQMVGFYDTGGIHLHDDPKNIAIATATGRNGYNLSGWGIGVNLLKNGSHAVRLGWASKIGSNPGRSTAGLDADSRADKSRVWLQATVWF